MKYIKTTIVLFLLTALLLAACAQGEVILQVTGNVASEKGWTEDQFSKLDTTEAEYTGKDGETVTYKGVRVTDLVNEAGMNDGVSTVILVGDDGYTAEVTQEELDACPDCIISLQDDGSLNAVMPGFTGKLQVKGVIEIQVN